MYQLPFSTLQTCYRSGGRAGAVTYQVAIESRVGHVDEVYREPDRGTLAQSQPLKRGRGVSLDDFLQVERIVLPGRVRYMKL